MRFCKNTTLALAFALTTSSARAFTITSSGRSLQKYHVLSHKTKYFQQSGVTSTVSPSLTRSQPRKMNTISMFFSNLFGAPTPSVIDYTTLDYPGNEMGKVAQEGEVIQSCERQPELEAATFAGGCFWGLELGTNNSICFVTILF